MCVMGNKSEISQWCKEYTAMSKRLTNKTQQRCLKNRMTNKNMRTKCGKWDELRCPQTGRSDSRTMNQLKNHQYNPQQGKWFFWYSILTQNNADHPKWERERRGGVIELEKKFKGRGGDGGELDLPPSSQHASCFSEGRGIVPRNQMKEQIKLFPASRPSFRDLD